MEVVRRALSQESFSFQGKHFQIPVPGIPDRGTTVQELTLIPRPLHPYEIWQAVTSPPTLDYVPVVDHGAVFWNQHYSFIKRFWDKYGENYTAAHGGPSSPSTRSGCWSCRSASRTRWRRPGRRHCPATTSSGSSSARTAGAAATWALTASRPRPG